MSAHVLACGLCTYVCVCVRARHHPFPFLCLSSSWPSPPLPLTVTYLDLLPSALFPSRALISAALPPTRRFSLALSLRGYVLVNDDGSRAFYCIGLNQRSAGTNLLVDAVDETLRCFDKPPFYKVRCLLPSSRACALRPCVCGSFHATTVCKYISIYSHA